MQEVLTEERYGYESPEMAQCLRRLGQICPTAVYPHSHNEWYELALARSGFVDDRIVVNLAHCWCHILLLYDQTAL